MLGQRTLKPERALAAIGLFLLIALVYNIQIRKFMIPRDFQYVPREAHLVLITGELRALWEGLRPHLDLLLEDLAEEYNDDSEDPFRRLLTEPTLLALQDYGWDIDNGMVLSIFPKVPSAKATNSERYSFSLSVPVSDKERFLQMFDHDTDGEPSQCQDESTLDLGNVSLAFPEPGTALLTDSCSSSRMILENRESNLYYARADDRLFGLLKRHYRRRPGSGPTGLLYLRSPSLQFSEVVDGSTSLRPPIRSVFASFKSKPSQVDLDIHVTLYDAEISTLNRFLEPPRRIVTTPQAPSGTLAEVHLRDSELSAYFSLIRRNIDIGELQEESLMELLDLVAKERTVDSIALYVTPHAVPQIVLRIEGLGSTLKELLIQSQRAMKHARDRRILSCAIYEYESKFGRFPAGVEDLRQSATLTAGMQDSSLDRWDISHGSITSPLANEILFRSPAYLTRAYGHEIHSLAPPFTDNDWICLEKDKEAFRAQQIEDLHDGRYRAFAVLEDGVLWAASLRDDLSFLENRETSTPWPPMNRPRSDPASKIELLLDLGAIQDEIVMDDEGGHGTPLREAFQYLELHTFLSFNVVTRGQGSDLSLHISLSRSNEERDL